MGNQSLTVSLMGSGEITAQAATVILIFILAGLTYLVLWISSERSKKRFRETLRRRYGTAWDPELEAEEYESIGHFAEDTRGNRFYIDDITWNDLGMDDIFLRMNQTVSSCGEDVLCRMLRVPEFSEDELHAREALMTYFDAHEKERTDVQYALAGIGRKRHMSQYDYIRKLDDAERVHTLRYVLLLLLTFAAIGFFFVRPAYGALAFVILLIFNIQLQLRNNDKTRMYVQSFNSVLRILHSVRELEKLNIPAIRPYVEELAAIRKKFAGFERGAILVTSNAQVGNGPMDTIMEYLKILFHFDMLKFNQMLSSYRGHREDCIRMIELTGLLDACISAASFRRQLPYYAVPSFETEESGETEMAVTDMFHPLIEEPVTNSFVIRGGNLVTGSNASGKSTFLKNTAICAVLAQSVATVPAKSYRAPFLKTMSSMALSDDLAAKESYFIVELKSIKRILDESEKEGRVLCLVDEVLRGTNTIERIAASSRILAAMQKPNVLALAATHDIELTYILEEKYRNLHFEETVTEEDVTFDYKLKEGRAVSRNAIRLLRMMGFDPSIVEAAGKAAEAFEKEGVWHVC